MLLINWQNWFALCQKNHLAGPAHSSCLVPNAQPMGAANPALYARLSGWLTLGPPLHGHGHSLSSDPTHDGRSHRTCKRKPTANDESSPRWNLATWPTHLTVKLLRLLYPVPPFLSIKQTTWPSLSITHHRRTRPSWVLPLRLPNTNSFPSNAR